ncbi:uncharacterized protein DS421_1g19050 [Arachis hypogaea]|nr:uncharacterized protein DS421_1g19050 [Arachis hypogaea]
MESLRYPQGGQSSIPWCMAHNLARPARRIDAQQGSLGAHPWRITARAGKQGTHHDTTALLSTRAGQHPNASPILGTLIGSTCKASLLCPPQEQSSLLGAIWAETHLKIQLNSILHPSFKPTQNY